MKKNKRNSKNFESIKVSLLRKAQASVETLLIYGVTILIVMLAISALIGFGIIDFGDYFPDECKLSEVMTCKSFLITPGQVQLQFENIHSRNIANFTVDIIGEKDNQGLWNCDQANYTQPLIVGDVSDIVYVNCDVKVPVGKKIKGRMTVKFKEIGL